MKGRFAVLWVCVVLLAPCLVRAQGFGAINGTITDPSGSAVPNAKITATQAGTSFMRDAAANSDGFFIIPSLSPATYHLDVTASGFKGEKEDVTVLADQSLTVNFQLTIGAASETVTISGTALRVDVSTSTLKQVVESTRINELPLNGRNVAQLATLVAGTTIAPNGGADQGAQKTFPGAQTISANGTRGDQTSYLLDGGDYMDSYTSVNQPFPFPDELQEFSVQTSNYTAEYGNNAGAVVNVITKSGTNEWHGDLFEYNRNPAFNAKNFLSPVDAIKRNQFGGTVGGPILHNKLFFFAGYQREALRNLATTSNHMPGTTDIANFLANGEPCANQGSAAGTGVGDVDACGTGAIDPSVAKMLGISTAGVPLTNPSYALAGLTSSGATFIPTGLNPQACASANASSTGVCPGSANFPVPDDENYDSGMGRLDYQLTANDKVTGRYEFDRFIRTPYTPPQELLAYTDGQTIISQNALLHETHTFSAMFLNDFRASYSRETSIRGPGSTAPDIQSFGSLLPDAVKPPAIQAITIQNASSSTASPGSGNGFSFGTNPTGAFIRNNFAYSDDVSWEKGKHDIHFGGNVERSQVDLLNNFNQPGLIAFCTNDSYLGQASSNAAAEGRYTFTNLLGGVLCDTGTTTYAFQQGGGEFKNDRNTFSGVYLQDNIRMSRRLTVNLGLRYEPALSEREVSDNRVTCINLALMQQNVHSTLFPDSPPGIFYGGDPQCPQNGMPASLNDFAPRVGFAWDVFGDGKTSVRGGGGIFFDSRVMGMLNNRFVDQWPYSPQFIESTAASPNSSSTAGSFTDPLCTLAATQAQLNCSGAQAASYKVNFPTFPGPYAPTKGLPVGASIPYPYVPGNNLIGSFDPTSKYNVPTTYAYNLTIERQLPWNSLIRLAYVGSISDHLLETIFLNASPVDTLNPATGTGTICKTFTAGVCTTYTSPGTVTTGLVNGILSQFDEPGTSTPIPATALSPSGVLEDAYDDRSNYNSGQLSFEKRASHGITLLVNYTYSKSLDDTYFGDSVSGFDGGPYSPVAFNAPNRHRMDYGPSEFDATHVLVGSFVWQTPTLHGRSSFVRAVFGGYELGGIVTASSGRPFTVIEGANNISGDGTNSERGTLCGQGQLVNSASTDGLSDPCVVGASPYNATAACATVTANCVGFLTSAAFEPFTVKCVQVSLYCTSAQVTSGSSVNNPAIYGTIGELGKNSFKVHRRLQLGHVVPEDFRIHRTLPPHTARRILQRLQPREFRPPTPLRRAERKAPTTSAASTASVRRASALSTTAAA